MLRKLLDLLLGPPYGGTASSVRWRWVPLRLIGPGSVPLALCLTAIGDAFLSDHYTNDRISLIFALASSAPVVLAGYRPLLAWIVAFGTFWSFAGTVVPIDPPQPWPWIPSALLAYLVVQFAVARAHGPATALATWVGPVLAGTLLSLDRGIPDSTANLQLTAVLSGFAIAFGSGVRLRIRARERLAAEERVATEERARRRLLEERTRIARELHDIVAHHMSVIVLQASSASHRLGESVRIPPSVQAEFDAIARSGRESLTEMRRLLAVLRSADERTDTEPQPGVRNLDRLVESARAAGTRVRVEGAGEVPHDLSETVSLTAYRIVQEALSNVVRHAPRAATTVRLGVRDGCLTVLVANQAAPAPAPASAAGSIGPISSRGRGSVVLEPPGSGPGLGLVGMRERVDLVGGELRYGAEDDGGFAVRASLPLAPEVSGIGDAEDSADVSDGAAVAGVAGAADTAGTESDEGKPRA